MIPPCGRHHFLSMLAVPCKVHDVSYRSVQPRLACTSTNPLPGSHGSKNSMLLLSLAACGHWFPCRKPQKQLSVAAASCRTPLQAMHGIRMPHIHTPWDAAAMYLPCRWRRSHTVRVQETMSRAWCTAERVQATQQRRVSCSCMVAHTTLCGTHSVRQWPRCWHST